MNPVHGTAIVVGRWGVLLRGPSGSGKSALAFHAMERARQAGEFAAWVADDRVRLVPVAGVWIASAPPEIAGRAERRYAGIEAVPALREARLDLVVDLLERVGIARIPDPSTVRPEGTEGPVLPLISVPSRAPAEAFALIEAALRRL